MTEILLLIGVGVFLGFFVGRWAAESTRARTDMRNTWRNRKNYRS